MTGEGIPVHVLDSEEEEELRERVESTRDSEIDAEALLEELQED